MEINDFDGLGLTESETRVFLALLKVGPAKAGEVIDNSGLQNPVVHRAFHSLIKKGLVTYSVEGKIKYYQNIDPRLLPNILEEKKRHLENIIPKLLDLKIKGKKVNLANVHQGVRGIRELLNFMLENCDKEFLAYGAPGRSLELLGDFFWEGFHKKRIRERIRARMIFHNSLKERASALNKLKLTEIKLTDVDFEELAETVIAGDNVAIILYLDNPIGILIEGVQVSNSYRKFFELLWKQAKS